MQPASPTSAQQSPQRDAKRDFATEEVGYTGASIQQVPSGAPERGAADGREEFRVRDYHHGGQSHRQSLVGGDQQAETR